MDNKAVDLNYDKNGIKSMEAKKQSLMESTVNMEEGIQFAWTNINVSTKAVPERKVCGFVIRQEKSSKQILREVSGIARPGEVLAIMGASGAGKSTLLNTLTFRHSEGLKVSGTRRANQQLLTPASLTALAGYVQQEDLFIPSLTVREHLLFQARLRLEASLTTSERERRVEEVLGQVGLTRLAGAIIGDLKLKGISGGEKKRLSFAAELLSNPSVLICDEPTSGLDSFMATNIMELLREFSRLGKTVVCTVHQPSSQIFTRFDSLLLLAEGRTAYLGPASRTKQFFAGLGFPCPEDFNPADHFVSVLAVVSREEKEEGGEEEESQKRVSAICAGFQDSQAGAELRAELKSIERQGETREDKQGSSLAGGLYKASWLHQLSALTWRQALSVVRDPMMFKVKITTAIVVGLILGVLYQGQEFDQAGIQNANGALFMIITNLSFGSIFSICNSFCSELLVFLREHFNGTYRTDAYFLSKQIVELPLYVLEASILFTILYWMAQLNPEAERFLAFLGIAFLILQVVMSLGYFLSCVTPSADIALAIAPVLIIPMMLFGGFYLNTGSIPAWLSWIQYISWFYYGYSAMMINQWAGVENIACQTNSTSSCINTGRDVLEKLNIDESNFARDILLLVLLAALLRIAAFLALCWKARRKS